VRICPQCGRENAEDARFCSARGTRLAAAAVEAREERKVVSVLFADLVGFTSRSEQLDPEDVRATLSPYYARLRSELERHGGTVEKFIGDAVMAVFGAPVAHEDDPSARSGPLWRSGTRWRRRGAPSEDRRHDRRSARPCVREIVPRPIASSGSRSPSSHSSRHLRGRPKRCSRRQP
jgi:class 3 adenylate cyclase